MVEVSVEVVVVLSARARPSRVTRGSHLMMKVKCVCTGEREGKRWSLRRTGYHIRTKIHLCQAYGLFFQELVESGDGGGDAGDQRCRADAPIIGPSCISTQGWSRPSWLSPDAVHGGIPDYTAIKLTLFTRHTRSDVARRSYQVLPHRPLQLLYLLSKREIID